MNIDYGKLRELVARICYYTPCEDCPAFDGCAVADMDDTLDESSHKEWMRRCMRRLVAWIGDDTHAISGR